MEQSSTSTIEIGQRLESVQARIAAAAHRAGRNPSEIRLIAVSKTHPAEIVRAAHRAGLCDFAENRVEEALPKIERLRDLDGVRWHMVGHIQSRKAKGVAAVFGTVHSVDRLKIARLLDRHAAANQVRLRVLLECNVSGESAKFGWPLADESAWPSAVEEFAEVQALEHLELAGLMTMAPLSDDPERVRPVFARLRALRDWMRRALPGDWSELSMGMTDDFEVAIEEGATMLRIGRAIFGPRREG